MLLPKYKEISNFILTEINNGKWAENEKLPSENDLADLLSTSRMTVRKSIEQLVQDGVLYRRPSVGTFVAPIKVQSSFLEIRNISLEIAERGHKHTSIVLSKVLMRPNEKVLKSLKLTAEAEVVRIVILHLEDDRPFQLEERYVNTALAPNFINQDFSQLTCTEYLNSILPITSAEISIEAMMPQGVLKHHLEMTDAVPCLKITRVTLSGEGTVSFANLYHPGNTFQLTGKLVSI